MSTIIKRTQPFIVNNVLAQYKRSFVYMVAMTYRKRVTISTRCHDLYYRLYLCLQLFTQCLITKYTCLYMINKCPCVKRCLATHVCLPSNSQIPSYLRSHVLGVQRLASNYTLATQFTYIMWTNGEQASNDGITYMSYNWEIFFFGKFMTQYSKHENNFPSG